MTLTTVAVPRPFAHRSTAPLSAVAVAEIARTHRDQAEHTGHLHREVYDALCTSGISSACLPQHLGGSAMAVPELIHAIIELANADAAAGWAAGIHGPAGIFTGLLDPDTARHLFDHVPHGTLLVGGSSQPAGTARQTPVGYRLTGRWPLVSGAHRIDTAFLAAQTVTTDGISQGLRWWCVPRETMTADDDWDSHGLRGSDSASITVTDLLLPERYSVDLSTPTDDGHDQLTRFPRYGLLAVCLAAVALGTAERSLTEFRTLAEGRSATTFTDQPAVRVAVADTTARLGAARLYLTHTITQAWRTAGTGAVPADLRAQLRLAAGEATRAGADVARRLFEAAGSAAVYRSTGLGDCLRDLDVITRHALLGAPGRQKAGGYLLTGTAGKDL